MANRRDDNIQASAAMQSLRARQWRELVPLLQREAARRALRVGVADDDAVPPLLGVVWTRLWVGADRYRGDLLASVGEPMPFADETFDLVWLQHALEPAPHLRDMLGEACRVLAAGGVLAVTAIHPLSAWAPWFCWQARGQRQSLRWPWRLQRCLAEAGLETEVVRRFGPFWPQPASGDSQCGGGYLLLARKRREAPLPIILHDLPNRVPAGIQLSPGTRRHAVS